MTEDLLHYIWKQELFEKRIVTQSGEQVEVLSTGMHNTDAGPDFINARIKIDGTIWAGNVEIHVDSSNWEKHKHQNDSAYNNVILHIVSNYSKPAYRKTGEEIPTATLNFDEEIVKKHTSLITKKSTILCVDDIQLIDKFFVNIWLESLCIERIEDKTEYILEVYKHTKASWEETFYQILAKSYGFNTNAVPFELLAKSIPLKIVSKYASNEIQLEALFFGQAGFLNESNGDDYYTKLQKEYVFLQKAHQLKPIDNHLWKFMRLRPLNFPTIRIAQFTSLLYKSARLFTKTLEAITVDDLIKMYRSKINPYWKKHYNFGKQGKESEKNIGKTALLGIFINTVIPFLFIYGKLRDKTELTEKALKLLSEIPAEKNSILTKWMEAGIKANNSAQSQALLQLTNQYCKQKNCLYCQFGNTIIRNKIK